MKNIVPFGAPGAGKGTHAALLAEKYDLMHLSTGDLLRHEVEADTPLGRQVKETMERGDLVDDETIVKLVGKAIGGTHRGIVFDGFPRTVAQAGTLDVILTYCQRSLDAVISIEVPRHELLRRMQERALIQHRTDDTEATFRHRLDQYDAKTRPVVDYYRSHGKFYSIDGSGNIPETATRLSQTFESYIV